MCGIWGQVWVEPQRQHAVDSISHFTQHMQHRGPDGYGVWVKANVALAHRRLAIIDIEGGHQPMSYADQRYWISFNGEIYNYRLLRQQLEHKGHQFHTQSDTEVILAAYAEWGSGCVTVLNGIFAFAIWDCGQNRLFCARDPLGIKPFLYHHDSHGFTFCSELKPLVADARIAGAGLNRQSVADYLANGYVTSPYTIVQNVLRLPPAHTLTLYNGQLSLARYWNMADFANAPALPNTVHTLDAFEQQLAKSVSMQMVSDVPLGAFLSGGLDSSAIVSLMASASSQRVQAFSMGFTEASYSELGYAKQVAQHVGADLHSDISSVHTVIADLQRLMWICDEPLGDSSLVPTYELSRLASAHTTVVLSGDGADELLAGYDTYVADWLHQMYQRLPPSLRQQFIRPLINALPQSPHKVNLQFRLAQFVRYADYPLPQAHLRWRQLFTDEERQALLPDAPAAVFDHTYERLMPHFEAVRDAHWLNQMLYIDLNTWLVDDILIKVDRASMANSLEARVPFLDHELVALALQLPPELKLQGTQRKIALKRVMTSRLPKATLQRQKRGFNAPTGIWLKQDLKEVISTRFEKANSQLVDLQAPLLKVVWQAYQHGQENHGYKLWALASLLFWEEHVWQPLIAAPFPEPTRITL